MSWSSAWTVARREPYRVFFPLAVVLGGVGVGHWLAYSLHLIAVFSPQGHALVQVEAFLMAFACGFLMTMLPRRSGTAPASSLEMIALMTGLLVLSAAAFTGHFITSQLAFIGVLVILGAFAMKRLAQGSTPRRPPDAFVLVPIGVAAGLIGSIILLVGVATDRDAATLLGRGLVQEGIFLCFVLGLGHMLLPLLAGFDIPPDGDDSSPSRRRRMLHALGGLVIIASFPLQHLLIAQGSPDAGARVGYLLRAGVFLADWGGCVRAWRWPQVPGLHRRFAWLAFWLVPTGELLAGALPMYRMAFVHVTFVGGFSLLCFTVGAHVIASHSGANEIVSGRPWQVWAFGVLFLASMLTRLSADFLPSRAYWPHLGWASFLWILGLALWTTWLASKLTRVPSSPHEGARELPVIRQS